MTRLIIDRAEVTILDLPFRRLQRFSALGASRQSTVLVRIGAKNGLVGVGEAVTPSGPWWGGESVESIKATLDTYVAPLLVGEDALAPRRLMMRLDRQIHGNSFAKAAVEMALFDLVGKFLDQPVHVLLGGAVRQSVPTSWPLATGDARQEIDEAEAKMVAGEACRFKMKMGAVAIRDDVARVIEVARALGGRAAIRVDPNEQWSEIDATWAVPRLAEAGIEMVEQPFPRWNLDASARLVHRTGMVVMLDESVRTSQDLLQVADRRAASLVSLKLMKSGGIAASRRIADLAVAVGLPLYMGTFLETSLGTAAGMQLCATLEDLPLGSELIGPLLIAEDIVQRPAEYRDHQIWLQPGPGLGVALDNDRVAAFTRGRVPPLSVLLPAATNASVIQSTSSRADGSRNQGSRP